MAVNLSPISVFPLHHRDMEISLPGPLKKGSAKCAEQSEFPSLNKKELKPLPK